MKAWEGFAYIAERWALLRLSPRPHRLCSGCPPPIGSAQAVPSPHIGSAQAVPSGPLPLELCSTMEFSCKTNGFCGLCLQEKYVEELATVRQTLQTDLETSIRRIADLQAALEEVVSSDSDTER